MELCGNLTQSFYDYESKNQLRPFKTAGDRHAANKVFLSKVYVNSSYGELYKNNDPLKINLFVLLVTH